MVGAINAPHVMDEDNASEFRVAHSPLVYAADFVVIRRGYAGLSTVAASAVSSCKLNVHKICAKQVNMLVITVYRIRVTFTHDFRFPLCPPHWGKAKISGLF